MLEYFKYGKLAEIVGWKNMFFIYSHGSGLNAEVRIRKFDLFEIALLILIAKRFNKIKNL